MEKQYLKHKYNKSKITREDIREEIEKISFQRHRLNVYKFIKSFPNIENNQTIGSWTHKVNTETSHKLSEVHCDKIQDTPYHANEITFELLFNENNNNERLNYHVGTVHSVKGCSLDATLLILKSNTMKNSYKNLLSDDWNIDYEDELRVIYVALSRAKKLLHLAVPQNDYEMWKEIFS